MLLVGVAAVAAIIIAVVVFALAGGGTSEYDNHLTMAQKYLDELDYEQAIVELRLAIEIEPNNSGAYFALADVYVAMEDYESALAVLAEGYAATGDEELSEERERIAGEYAELQEQQAEQEKIEQEQRVKEFYEKYAELFTFANEALGGSRGYYDKYLTYAEREQAYGELVEQLEQFLADLDGIEGLPENLYGADSWWGKVGAYSNLADAYLRMGRLEECLRARTEWSVFCDRPDLVQDGNHGYAEQTNYEFDRYGRITSYYDEAYGMQGNSEYGEFHDGVLHDVLIDSYNKTICESDTTYDSEGRVLHRHTVITFENGEVVVWDWDYSYTGNNSFVTTYTYIKSDENIEGPVQEEQFYDKYGREIDP